MPRGKKHAPEEIVAKLRQVEVMTGQGTPVVDAIRAIGVTEATYYRWRQEFGGLKLSPDGKWIVAGSDDGTAHVWQSGMLQSLVLHADSPITSVAFSPDGKWIVAGSDDGIARVWKESYGEFSRVLGRPRDLKIQSPITSVAFSPDGTRIVTGSGDGNARVWLASGAGEPLVLRGEGAITSAAFSPDGMLIVTGSVDGTARVWPFVGTLEQLAAYARALKLPRLTEAQNRKYFIIDD